MNQGMFDFTCPPGPTKPTTRERALQWIEDNPLGWQYFVKFAHEAARSGRPTSIAMIRERVRWECYFGPKTEEFKISNDYSPHFARFLMEQYTALDGMFVIKKADLS